MLGYLPSKTSKPCGFEGFYSLLGAKIIKKTNIIIKCPINTHYHPTEISIDELFLLFFFLEPV